MIDVLASLWLVTTIIAFLLARRRQIVQHRQWMIRSYSVTFFIFVLNRLPGIVFPLFNPSTSASICRNLTLALLAILIPDIAFTWSQLRGSRKQLVGQSSDRPVRAEGGLQSN